MDKKNINGRLYLIEKYYWTRKDGWHYERSKDGTLFARDRKSKVREEDLPEWYIYGRYYKRFGFLKTKGITDLKYCPNKWVNHYLKDDCLYIAYGGKITEKTDGTDKYERYVGWNERIWGNEILDVVKGARDYSHYDITEICQQLKEKAEWIRKEYPDEFGPDHWKFDVDEYMQRPIFRRESRFVTADLYGDDTDENE